MEPPPPPPPPLPPPSSSRRCLNSSLNFFVYYRMGSRFRQALWTLLPCSRAREGRYSAHSGDSAEGKTTSGVGGRPSEEAITARAPGVYVIS